VELLRNALTAAQLWGDATIEINAFDTLITALCNLPWREAGPPNHLDDKLDSVNTPAVDEMEHTREDELAELILRYRETAKAQVLSLNRPES